MTLYSAKGGVETYYFHYTSNSDIPVEAICWNEGEEDQPIEIPSTTDDTTNTADDLKHAISSKTSRATLQSG